MVWAFIAGAVIALAMAFCYAEAGSVLPSAGGAYTIVRRALGPVWGGVTTILFLVLGVVITASIPVAAATYLAQPAGGTLPVNWLAFAMMVAGSDAGRRSLPGAVMLAAGLSVVIEVLAVIAATYAIRDLPAAAASAAPLSLLAHQVRRPMSFRGPRSQPSNAQSQSHEGEHTMPSRESAPAGAPCWVDLMTSDTRCARDFYRELLGWGAEEPNEQFGGYINFTRNGTRIAGCMPSEPGQGPANVWAVYLASDDAAKTVAAASEHGGRVLVPPMQVGDLGTMAVVSDPDGAGIGVWQPGTHRGFGVYAEDGAPAWFELHTRGYQAVLPFYRDVFGWNTNVVSDTPEFRYTVQQVGEEQLAGVMDASGFLPEGVPSRWAVYFAVPDTDAAVAKLTSLGGTVDQPAEDTPYGRLAGVADPLGARFRLIGPSNQPAR